MVSSSPRIVVAGGHSAGHIEPAMNFADAVRRLDPSAEITALGTERGLDTTLIPARGYPLELIPPVPLPRRSNKACFAVPGGCARSVRAAGAVLDRTGAQVVVGFGGYVAMPAYIAARRRRIPIVIHEANARPGVANKVAARLTKHVFTASKSVQLRHGVPIGIPLRPAIADLDRAALRAEARVRFGLDPEGPVLMVTGGSQGAQAINTRGVGAAPQLRAAGVQVLHIAGPKNVVEVAAGTPPYVVVALRRLDAICLCRSRLRHLPLGRDDLRRAHCGRVACRVRTLAFTRRRAAHNAEPIVAAGGGVMVDERKPDPGVDRARGRAPHDGSAAAQGDVRGCIVLRCARRRRRAGQGRPRHRRDAVMTRPTSDARG